MDEATIFARTLRRAPFALLSWVLSALTPADLLGPECRRLVIRMLVDTIAAVGAATFAAKAEKERTMLGALEDRARAAFVALGEDAGALTDEALPAPSAVIDGRTVARVMFAFARELHQRGIDAAKLAPMTLDAPWCDALATRASAIEPPKSEKPGAQKPGRKKKPRAP